MANIRTKTWAKSDGSIGKSYEVTYTDLNGERCTKSYKKWQDADTKRIEVESQIKSGMFVSEKRSCDVITGLRAWHSYMEGLLAKGKRERCTVDKYKWQIERYISKADIAAVNLATMSGVDVQNFIEYLETNLSTAMAKKVYQTFKTGLRYCRKHHWLATMPTDDYKIEQRDREQSGKVYIPPKEQIRALLKAADTDITGINGAMVRSMCLCGLRPSEMRGLPRQKVFLDEKPARIEVAQRADLYGKIGCPKSRAGYRTIPIGDETVKAFKKALLARKAGRHNLMFPNPEGEVMAHHNFIHRRWAVLMKKAGLAKVEKVTHKSNPKKKVERIKPFFPPYSLRHVAASRWIEMGLMPKRIQQLMGHSTLQMTMDTYGHLWANPEVDMLIANETDKAFA